MGSQQVDAPKAAVGLIKTARAAKKPLLLRILREGQSLFIAISPDGSTAGVPMDNGAAEDDDGN